MKHHLNQEELEQLKAALVEYYSLSYEEKKKFNSYQKIYLPYYQTLKAILLHQLLIVNQDRINNPLMIDDDDIDSILFEAVTIALINYKPEYQPLSHFKNHFYWFLKKKQNDEGYFSNQVQMIPVDRLNDEFNVQDTYGLSEYQVDSIITIEKMRSGITAQLEIQIVVEQSLDNAKRYALKEGFNYHRWKKIEDDLKIILKI